MFFYTYSRANMFNRTTDLYSILCYVEGDTSKAPLRKKCSKSTGAVHYSLDYDIILSLGLTEFKAYIAWQENVSNIL